MDAIGFPSAPQSERPTRGDFGFVRDLKIQEPTAPTHCAFQISSACSALPLFPSSPLPLFPSWLSLSFSSCLPRTQHRSKMTGALSIPSVPSSSPIFSTSHFQLKCPSFSPSTHLESSVGLPAGTTVTSLTILNRSIIPASFTKNRIQKKKCPSVRLETTFINASHSTRYRNQSPHYACSASHDYALMIALPLSPALLLHHGPMSTTISCLLLLAVIPTSTTYKATVACAVVVVVVVAAIVSSEHLPAEVDEDFVYVCCFGRQYLLWIILLWGKEEMKEKKKHTPRPSTSLIIRRIPLLRDSKRLFAIDGSLVQQVGLVADHDDGNLLVVFDADDLLAERAELV